MGNDLEHFQQICDLKTETINNKLDDLILSVKDFDARSRDSEKFYVKVDEFIAEIRKLISDHEERIRVVERDKKSQAAMITAVTTMIGAIVAFFFK